MDRQTSQVLEISVQYKYVNDDNQPQLELTNTTQQYEVSLVDSLHGRCQHVFTSQ